MPHQFRVRSHLHYSSLSLYSFVWVCLYRLSVIIFVWLEYRSMIKINIESFNKCFHWLSRNFSNASVNFCLILFQFLSWPIIVIFRFKKERESSHIRILWYDEIFSKRNRSIIDDHRSSLLTLTDWSSSVVHRSLLLFLELFEWNLWWLK